MMGVAVVRGGSTVVHFRLLRGHALEETGFVGGIALDASGSCCASTALSSDDCRGEVSLVQLPYLLVRRCQAWPCSTFTVSVHQWVRAWCTRGLRVVHPGFRAWCTRKKHTRDRSSSLPPTGQCLRLTLCVAGRFHMCWDFGWNRSCVSSAPTICKQQRCCSRDRIEIWNEFNNSGALRATTTNNTLQGQSLLAFVTIIRHDCARLACRRLMR